MGTTAQPSPEITSARASAIADPFDLPQLDRALANTPFSGQIRYFPTIQSTNTFAMREAEEGRPAGSVYIADEQTGGRGRGAHAWHSAPGSGIYVSVLLRPAIAPADALWLSLAAGLAVQSAVREVTALEADIRWPNDLLLSGKKFCGILTELNAEVTRVRHAVIGIGINVHQPAFPSELSEIATSLAIEAGRSPGEILWRRQDLLTAVLRALHNETAALEQPGAMQQVAPRILGRMREHSSWIFGKPVTVEEAETFSGITDGLDTRGFLRVRTADGLRTVLSGGVRAQDRSPNQDRSTEVQKHSCF